MIVKQLHNTKKGFFYQLQKNGTLHLVKISKANGKTYLPFVPGLNIPIIKSFHKKDIVVEQRKATKKRCNSAHESGN